MDGLYNHHSDYHGPWPWPDFTPAEVACRHCGELYLHAESMEALQDLRERWGKPVRVTSGHRCAAHNKAVGGANSSRHLTIAFDCVCPEPRQKDFLALAAVCGFSGLGRYPTRGFVHLDMGPRRVWAG